MSQFTDRIYFGYKVILRPSWNDFLRPWLIIPIVKYSILPYFTGADLVFSLKIKPTKHAMNCRRIEYNWFLYKKGVEEPIYNKGGINELPQKTYKSKILSILKKI